MHSWEKFLALDEEETKNKLFSYYKFPFTTEVRSGIAPWIEQTFGELSYLDPINPNHQPQVEGIMTNMLRELQAKALSPDISNEMSESIAVCAKNVQDHFSTIALALFEHVRNCLQLERDLLNEPKFTLCEPQEFTWDIFQRLKICHDELIQQHTSQNALGYGYNGSSAQLELQMTIFGQMCQDFVNEFEAYISKMSLELTARTSFRLAKWKEERQIFSQGKLSHPFTIELEELQKYYEYYANHLWCLWDLVKRVGKLIEQLPADLKGCLSPEHMDNVRAMKSKVETKLKKFVSDSFVVKTQPSQIIVKDTTVGEPTVQLLIGKEIRSRARIDITCHILDEVEALEYANAKYDVNVIPPFAPTERCVKLKNNSVKLTTNNYSGNFNKTMLNGKINRLKSNTDFPQYSHTPYYDENNWFYFHGSIKIHGIQFTLAEFSHPIKLTTNSSQKPACLGTLLFDIAAGRFGVESVLANPRPKIFWHDFELAFLVWFKEVTGRYLDPTEFYSIKKKLLRLDYFDQITKNPMTEFPSEQLRKKDHGRAPDKYSFGDWLYSMTIFIKKFLGPQTMEMPNGITMTKPGLWENRVFRDLFMDGDMSVLILPKNCHGSFLIRFSYTVTDAITIDFVSNGTAYSHRCTSAELKDGSLMDLIRDVPVWEVLYPGEIKRVDLVNQYALPRDPNVKVKLPYIKTLTEVMSQFSELSLSNTNTPSSSPRNPLSVY